MADNQNNKPNAEYSIEHQLKELKQDIITPHKFAKIFSDAMRESKGLDESIQKCLKELIAKDDDIKKEIFERIKDYIKEERKLFNTSVWKTSKDIILLIVGAGISFLFTWLAKFL